MITYPTKRKKKYYYIDKTTKKFCTLSILFTPFIN